MYCNASSQFNHVINNSFVLDAMPTLPDIVLPDLNDVKFDSIIKQKGTKSYNHPVLSTQPLPRPCHIIPSSYSLYYRSNNIQCYVIIIIIKYYLLTSYFYHLKISATYTFNNKVDLLTYIRFYNTLVILLLKEIILSLSLFHQIKLNCHGFFHQRLKKCKEFSQAIVKILDLKLKT
jgi:hypothetical protein